MVKGLWVALAGALLSACGSPAGSATGTMQKGAPPSATPSLAAGFDAGPVRSAADYLAEPRFATANFERGELLALACAACHRFRAGEGTLIGPNLHGVFGRRAAVLAEFGYSPALAASGLVWTPVSLEAWLAEPASFVNGTTMAFSGYRSADDRRDLIAYLLKITQ
jgi:cytochrome c